MNQPDPYHLYRFVVAQNSVYDTVLRELQNGYKISHWMWFVFPQLKELGFSDTAKFYGINDIAEAKAYLRSPVLRERLEECIQLLLNCGIANPGKIFGYPDSLKFHSSLTLFSLAEPENPLFKEAIKCFYQGITDYDTERLVMT